MKHCIYLLLLACLFQSCDRDDFTQEDSIEEATSLQKWRNPGDTNEYAFDHEGSLVWASRITADCIIDNLSLRNYVISKIDPTTHAVDLYDLLNGTGSAAFRYRFQELLNGRQLAKPDSWDKFPIVCLTCPKSTQSTDRPDTSARYVEMVDFEYYLTVENCTELYFPNLLHPTNADPIVSTAHPLNANHFNEGLRHELGDNGAASTSDALEYFDIDLDYQNVQAGEWILVMRPKRDAMNTNCQYSGYRVDFTLFLSHLLYNSGGGGFQGVGM